MLKKKINQELLDLLRKNGNKKGFSRVFIEENFSASDILACEKILDVEKQVFPKNVTKVIVNPKRKLKPGEHFLVEELNTKGFTNFPHKPKLKNMNPPKVEWLSNQYTSPYSIHADYFCNHGQEGTIVCYKKEEDK